MNHVYMKFIFLFLLLTTLLSAQTDRVYLNWDLSKPASFPGGQGAFYDYFKNTPYPSDTTIRPSGNRLVVGFVVEQDGRSADLRFFQTPGPAFTAAVITAMQGMKWNWAEANGHPVRQLKYLCFLFHHSSKRVTVMEHGLYLDYAAVQALDPDDYHKLSFPTEERFMGYTPEDTLATKQRYPEAAKAAGVQGEVGVAATLQPDGSLSGLTLLNDIGYGCGEEALRLTRLLKNWVPAQVFDSAYATPREFIYSFCADLAVIESSDKLYEEGEIAVLNRKYSNDNLLTRTKAVFLTAEYVLGEDFNLVPYNNAIAEVDFVVEKNGKASAIKVGGSASEYQRALARRYIETTEWTAPKRCNRPCRMHYKRYLYFHRGLEQNSNQHKAMLVFSKSALPAGMLWSDIRCDTIFEPVGVDQPAVYKFGPKSIDELVVLHWPRYKSELPPGKEILIRVLVPENGHARYMELISGVGAEVDKKALAVLKRASDYWTPAYKNGRTVSSWSVVRIGR